ncbi:palmitoyltransferase ZDHHC6 isoform X1 [Myotis myotis]|uniref:Palmitoyltransferase n=2 Tax=Myotis myotis TaxID=51298 RepID=A0A7J7TV99_MYOMY|nr:palmitoyltransferase ZDHHC6 isoform X1 [Myotis myotis]XP_036191874.1 palmitoyltransferase ZDHHC6 isoform X1 [Myotis myotis]XP_036191875.1 palmitoyltransferase ZDHHC6 isoform X1 [Myotis myotis]XP_036191876.1 palmitoyltransferase ZDHHC6 isoform X1 [Myotis myotis]KAF6304535.1 zinc finger DHHC-type palmitoyltransferase 6 [Myotis myotis]
MGTFCSVIKFENLQELKRLCHWGPIIALGVIAICSTMAMIDSVLWYWPLHTTGGSVNFIMLINWTVMILYNYFNAMFIGPGFVPLGWKPENSQDSMYLQYCQVCQAYKAPRSHHCRKCSRCVLKMDHHCPWINNCCGYQNHASFTLFLLLAPLGCIHAAFIFVMTMYTQLYNRLSFGWNTVKIDMSAARRDPLPIIPFGLAAFAATLFALGLALGTTIAVGMLFFIQIKIILRNQTSIESWIEEKAKDRIQYYQLDEVFVFPYDMGSRWKNFKQVFTWSGVPEGDGLEWPVREGCHQYSLTIEQLKQKADKRVRSVRYKVIEDYSGACCPLNKGIKTFFTSPCTEEPRIPLQKGEFILATRGLRYWLYGDKILDDSFIEGVSRIRGWFPRNCVEKCPCDAETEQAPEGEKKNR